MQLNIKAFRVLTTLILLAGFTGCITDEYDIGELDLEESWEFQLSTPIFKGTVLLKHLLPTGETAQPLPGESVTEVQFSSDSSIYVGSEFFYKPNVFLKDFAFHVSDKGYELKEGKLRFIVTNSYPFQVNLETSFYTGRWENSNRLAFLPPPFAPVIYKYDTIVPVTTIHEMEISKAGLELVNKNKVGFSLWFDAPNNSFYIQQLAATIPVTISVVLSGTYAERKEQENENH